MKIKEIWFSYQEITSLTHYFGQQWLKHCIAAKPRILNAQARDDLEGDLSHFLFQGCSTVDLVLACKSLLESLLIHYLSVQDFNIASDQKLILLKIPNNYLLEISKNPANYILEDRTPKDQWGNFLEKSYEKHLVDEWNLFVRHNENVSSDTRRNSLIEDLVLSIQKAYIQTANKVLKNVRNVKRKMSHIKTGNGSTKSA